jgi:hypothetical protein
MEDMGTNKGNIIYGSSLNLTVHVVGNFYPQYMVPRKRISSYARICKQFRSLLLLHFLRPKNKALEE